ncbi:MAG: helix-turn-helix transcriptional regulator [bacterium]|nr:helix-turn-helix transcriptional regulator [bacterium]
MASFYQKLGKKIYYLRKAQKLSRERFAEMADMSDYFLGEIERGEKKASIDTLFKICEVLEIKLHELVNVE